MTDQLPDLEIYIMKANPEAVHSWLATLFTVEIIKSAAGHHHYRCNGMDVFLNEGAEKNFASLWFKQNKTSWHSDLELARVAHSALETEIRCSAVGWKEGDESATTDDSWIKLNKGQEKVFEWH